MQPWQPPPDAQDAWMAIEKSLLMLTGSQVPQPRPGSELDRLDREMPDAAVVGLTNSLQQAVRTAQECARSMGDALFGEQPRGPGPAVLILARSLLLASGRVIYALGAEDDEVRLAHCLQVISQESGSLLQGMEEAHEFTQLHSLRPSDEFLAEVKSANRTVQKLSRIRGERAMLREMAQAISEAAGPAGLPAEFAPTVREAALWVFHCYSGMAHGYAWSFEVGAGDPSVDLWIVGTLGAFAVRLMTEMCRAPEELGPDDVPLDA
ncbi:hypothetical protein FAM15192_001701 [Propionibacterium freudenreichii]|uniref:hypothetical protein n=2 Tax=Propionibacterium freudenreichii TaxID=1744 RepID=UPI002550CA4C|nr:hypothetical protein [Propionibacterium freudenreichii]MDK9294868.1 hypothetical protein [Propionibacterium freudenreichii]MDK9640090.1 hypothetical protein [Propionibacterium freudenreichii]